MSVTKHTPRDDAVHLPPGAITPVKSGEQSAPPKNA